MQFVADGEFGIETVEANSVTEAAQIVAERHAGIECVEVCKDPFWFSIAPANAPDEVRNFQVEICDIGLLIIQGGQDEQS